MGRLFWKIFAVILVAQIAGNVAVAVLFWVEHNQREAQHQAFLAGHGEAATRAGAEMPPALRPPRPEDFADRGAHPGEPRPFLGDPGHPPRAELRPPEPPHGLPPLRFPYPPIIAGAITSLLFAALLARYLSRPIMALRRAFTAVAKGDFDIRPTAEIGSRRDELAELGVEFEHTAHQLKGLIGSQRRLLHDVSHEVRSPLARMQLAIDLARQQPDKTDASMQRIERESARIDHLVGELLTLSRLEAGSCGALEEEIDLRELVEEVVADAQFEAAAVNRQVVLNVHGEALVRGRGDLLQRAIENVVRNAVRHTFEGTTVQVRLQAEGTQVRIVVEDDGPGLPEAALDAIFEPFVRFREEHSNDGYGLGLAITRQTILAHGGSVHAANREHGGLRVEMRLPTSDLKSPD